MSETILDNQLLGRLLDVGFMSVNVGLVEEARQIFTCLGAERQDRVEPALGMALLTWRVEGTDAALMLLDQIRTERGEEPALQAFTAMVLAASGRSEEALALARTLISTGSPETRAFARGLVRDLSESLLADEAATV